MMSRNRIIWLDSVKGFTIIGVIIAHVSNMYYDHGMYGTYASLYTSLSNIMDSFMMALFFIASGYSFGVAYTNTEESYLPLEASIKQEKVIAQTINLTILYLLWGTVYCVLKFLFAGEVLEPSEFQDILLLPLKAPSLFWYLYVLIICYFMIMLYKRWQRNITALLVLSIILSVVQFWLTMNGRSAWSISLASRYLLFFLIGFISVSYTERIQLRISIAVPISMIIIGGIIEGTYWVQMMRTRNHIRFIWSDIPIWGVVIPLFLACGIFGIFTKLNNSVKCRKLSVLGRCALEIYLLHRYVMMILRKLLQQVPVNGLIALILNCLLTASVCIFLSNLLNKCIVGRVIFKPWRTIHEIKNR